MAEQQPSASEIEEDDQAAFEYETIYDPKRLKRIRSTGKAVLTKSGKKLMAAIRVSDDRDTVRALRANYVRDYDDLERRHDRFINVFIPLLTPEAIDGEGQWLQAVILEYKSILASCDNYLKESAPSSIHSRRSSHHSSVSSALVKM